MAVDIQVTVRNLTELISELQADNQGLRLQMKIMAVEMGIITNWMTRTSGVKLLNTESEAYKIVHEADEESEEIAKHLAVTVAVEGEAGTDFSACEDNWGVEVPSAASGSPDRDPLGGPLESEYFQSEDAGGSAAVGIIGEFPKHWQNPVPMKNAVIRLRRLEDEPSLLPSTSTHVKSDHNRDGGKKVRPATAIGAKKRTTHAKKKRPHKCGKCHKSFSSPYGLKVHDLSHTKLRPYACAYCGARFGQASNKRRHEMIHTGEKPFKCPFCDKSFRLKDSLDNHKRSHTNERPFQCGRCGQSFTLMSNLKKHERVHNGEKKYACGYCDAKFHYSTQKRNHEMSHTGEYPFECTFCGKRFTDRAHMEKHLERHAKEQPYTCDVTIAEDQPC